MMPSSFSLAGIPFDIPATAAWCCLIEWARLTGVPELIRGRYTGHHSAQPQPVGDGAASLSRWRPPVSAGGWNTGHLRPFKSRGLRNGLSEERIAEQHREIDQLNQRYKPFRILRALSAISRMTEALDYRDEVLARFDLVIVSVHSNLKMMEEKAMARLLKAIEKPYTTIWAISIRQVVACVAPVTRLIIGKD